MKSEPEGKGVPAKILRSAFFCLAQKGYASVSLRDIAEEAGVALSQLTYYFHNKEGLFCEILRMTAQEYVSEIERRLKGGRTPKERWNRFLDYFKTLMHERPEGIRLLFDLISMSMWNPSFKNLLGGLFDRVSELLRKYVFDESLLKEKLRGFSSEAMAKSAVGAVFGTALQYALNPHDKMLFESMGCIELPF